MAASVDGGSMHGELRNSSGALLYRTFGDRGPLVYFSVGRPCICADLGFRSFPFCPVSPSSLQASLYATPGRRACVADGQGRPAPPPDLEGKCIVESTAKISTS